MSIAFDDATWCDATWQLGWLVFFSHASRALGFQPIGKRKDKPIYRLSTEVPFKIHVSLLRGTYVQFCTITPQPMNVPFDTACFGQEMLEMYRMDNPGSLVRCIFETRYNIMADALCLLPWNMQNIYRQLTFNLLEFQGHHLCPSFNLASLFAVQHHLMQWIPHLMSQGFGHPGDQEGHNQRLPIHRPTARPVANYPGQESSLLPRARQH